MLKDLAKINGNHNQDGSGKSRQGALSPLPRVGHPKQGEPPASLTGVFSK